MFLGGSKGFQPMTRQHIPGQCLYVGLASESQELSYSDLKKIFLQYRISFSSYSKENGSS